MHTHTVKLWLLVEQGLTGTENQLVAVLEALKSRFANLDVTWHRIERGAWLFPRMDRRWFWHSESEKPDLVLAAGRLAIWPALGMKGRGASVAFLQDPRWPRGRFDRIYAGAHDKARGDNVMLTDGTLTRIRPMEVPPEPGRIALVIGGLVKGRGRCVLDDGMLDQLRGRGALVTFSRRTPASVKEQVRNALPDATIYDPMQGGDNPYLDFLRRAEIILVTNDSTAMMSDACSAGRAVYILPFMTLKGRHAAFQRHLQDIGVARPYDGTLIPFAPRGVLNDADKVASDIAERFLAR